MDKSNLALPGYIMLLVIDWSSNLDIVWQLLFIKIDTAKNERSVDTWLLDTKLDSKYLQENGNLSTYIHVITQKKKKRIYMIIYLLYI